MKSVKKLSVICLGVFVLVGMLGIGAWRSGEVKAGDDNSPVFSKDSGYYKDEFSLDIQAAAGSTIYYTTDGSVPLAKEDAIANPTPTPESVEIGPDVEFDLSPNNAEFVDSVLPESVKGGTKLTFDRRYRSICFPVPKGEEDWSGYVRLVINYSVDSCKNGRNIGLQACPIYSWAWSSYGERGETRCFEAYTSSEVGEEDQTWEIILAGKDVSSVGWILLGTTNADVSGDVLDSITVHSISLSKNGLGDPNPKQNTKTYTASILVKDRSRAANVLSAKENTKLMYHTGHTSLYTPKDDDVAKATVIRAVAVDAEGNRSPVVTKTYFVGEDIWAKYKNASIISVVTDQDNLLDQNKGIYRVENYENKGVLWERPAFVEYFDTNGNVPFATNMGIRLHGGWSRHYGQKSFNLYFREDLEGFKGLKNLKGYELIPGATNFDKTKPTTKYKNFMLRNGGNDTEYTKLQDVWIQSLVQDRAFTTQTARPCILFLNGEYWGLYNLTEKYGDNYIEEEFGVDKDNVVVIKDGEIDEGTEADAVLYEELQDLAKLNMKEEVNYKKFCDAVDIQSYVDYYAMEIYIGNYDWPTKNFQIWRTREKANTKYADTKWRWMLYDTEYSMNLYGRSTGSDPIGWVLGQDKLFAAVYKNELFREKFTTAMCDLMNSNFKPDTAIASLNEYVELYKPLMAEYVTRFGLNPSEFDSNVSRMKTFVESRRLAILTTLKVQMDAESHTTMTLKSDAASEIKVNTTTAKLVKQTWTGTYFKKFNVTLSAPNVEGYTFTGWKVANAELSSMTDQTVTAKLSNNSVIEAVYKSVNATAEPQETQPVVTLQPTITPTATPAPKEVVKVPAKVIVKSVKANKKALGITLGKVKNAKGYQVVIAKDKKFTKGKKLIYTKKTALTLSKLKSKQIYYIKVRAYNTKSSGEKLYGAYSVVKFKKVK